MKLIKTTYMRQLIGPGGCWLGEEPVELSAECEQFGDEVLVIWTDETLALLLSLDLDCEELVGCDECMTEAFWRAEEEACRVYKIQQQLGKVEAA